MLLLVIDTSLQGVTVGLASLNGKKYEILEIYGSNHPQEAAARLPELCQNLLIKRRLVLKDIGALLVSHGPGSFTGIKIGLGFASGWKRAGTATKVWCVSSFKGLLNQCSLAQTLILPATQTAGYLTVNLKDKLQGTHEPKLGTVDLTAATVCSLVDDRGQWLKSLLPSELGPIMILGRWPRLEEWLSSQPIDWKTLETGSLYTAVVAGMVEEFIAKSEQLSEGELVPVYLRKSAPEEKLDNLTKAAEHQLSNDTKQAPYLGKST